MIENKLENYIKYDDDLDSLRKKMSKIKSAPSTRKSVILSVSMCTYYTEADIPEKLIATNQSPNARNAKALCKEIYELYLLLIDEEFRSASDFIRDFCALSHTDSEIIDTFLFGLARISAIFNIFIDYMEARVYEMGEDVNSVCDSFDKKMYSTYSKLCEQLIAGYIELINS